jgi:hypothetical protein
LEICNLWHIAIFGQCTQGGYRIGRGVRDKDSNFYKFVIADEKGHGERGVGIDFGSADCFAYFPAQKIYKNENEKEIEKENEKVKVKEKEKMKRRKRYTWQQLACQKRQKLPLPAVFVQVHPVLVVKTLSQACWEVPCLYRVKRTIKIKIYKYKKIKNKK